MARPTTPDEAALAVALGPKSVTVDGSTVVAQSLDEIEKAKQLLARSNADATSFGIRMTQLLPPGANR